MKKNLKVAVVAMSLCLVGGLMGGCGPSNDNFAGKWGTQATNVNFFGPGTPAYESLDIQKNGDSYVVNIRRASYNISKQETKAPQVVLEWTADPKVGKLVMTKKSDNVLEANAGQLTYIEKDKTLLFTGPLGNLTYKPENKALIDSVKQNAQAFWKDRLENKLFMVDFGYPRFVVKDIKFVDKQAK